jgi:uncharacterized protein
MSVDLATLAATFAPNGPLAEELLSHVTNADGAHDISHLVRVWNNVRAIMAGEGGEPLVLTASAILHDCAVIPKDSSLRSQASNLSAQKAAGILRALGWDANAIVGVWHAIEAHSFSAGIRPTTLEARILQDADRLDALGMVGVARCFHVGGQLGRALYAPFDPAAHHRTPDDTRYTIDHFRTKLFKIAGDFQTATGARLAKSRRDRLQRFFDEFIEEVSPMAQ